MQNRKAIFIKSSETLAKQLKVTRKQIKVHSKFKAKYQLIVS